MKLIVVLTVLAIIVFSGCSNQNQSLVVQQPGQTSTNPAQQEPVQLRQVELSIEGLYCEGCVYGMQSIMKTTPGIESAEIKITDYAAQTGTAKITYDPQKITKEKIAKLTEPYQSKIVKDSSIN